MVIKKILYSLSSLIFIVGLIACDNDAAKSKQTAPTVLQSQQSVQASPAPQASTTKGKVLEKMDASNYTYVRLNDGAGNEIWAALPKTELEIGEEISLTGGTVMRNFNSKSLNRTFESIIFATGAVRGSGEKTAQVSASSHGTVSQSSGGSARTIVAFADLKVGKSTAQNGYTVGELFSKAVDLNKKKITVKGQVVKFSPNIMGRNWIHIQDGTGDPAKNTHDLVVTSSETTEKGAIISVEGVLSADKDFGSGYRYEVIIEEAVVVKSE